MMAGVLGDLSPGVFGVAWLFLGKPVGAGPRSGRPVADLVPEVDMRWCQGVELGSGVVAWEISPPEDTRAERRLVVLAPAGRDHELGVWTWSDGGAAMPPLARYLMHVAKLRYELRVFDGFPAADGLCRASEQARARLQADDAGERLSARAALPAIQARISQVLTAVRAMRRTVEIAGFNAAAALRAAPEAPADGATLISDDIALARHFAHRLDDDRAYLENEAAGAEHLARLTAPPPASVATPEAPTFGIVTAMPEELAAVRAVLDGERRRLVPDDRASYFIGEMPGALPDAPHTVVVTMLGETGTNAAADGCANLVRSFGSVDCVLMVGIAAGVPNPARPREHVRLGDIVVATWGVVDYDHVVETPDGTSLRQSHPRPSPLLGHAAKLLRADERMGRRPWNEHLATAVAALPEFARPDPDTDVLHGADDRVLAHPDLALSGHRPGEPKVHHGRIGSADRSLRNQRGRDDLAARHQLRAVEMEGTGVGKSAFAGGREWFVVRGVSDYADRQLTMGWRDYAALVAAAYTRALLGVVPPLELRRGHFRLPDR
jgi:nucleoside phosphorylase